MDKCFGSVKVRVLYTTRRLWSVSLKDKLSITSTNNNVYKFLCQCSNWYVGRSTRRLQIQIEEHVPTFIRSRNITSKNIQTEKKKRFPSIPLQRRSNDRERPQRLTSSCSGPTLRRRWRERRCRLGWRWRNGLGPSLHHAQPLMNISAHIQSAQQRMTLLAGSRLYLVDVMGSTSPSVNLW